MFKGQRLHVKHMKFEEASKEKVEPSKDPHAPSVCSAKIKCKSEGIMEETFSEITFSKTKASLEELHRSDIPRGVL